MKRPRKETEPGFVAVLAILAAIVLAYVFVPAEAKLRVFGGVAAVCLPGLLGIRAYLRRLEVARQLLAAATRQNREDVLVAVLGPAERNLLGLRETPEPAAALALLERRKATVLAIGTWVGVAGVLALVLFGVVLQS